MANTKRPRVAAIGLDDVQLQSIGPLCGELRAAHSLAAYLQDYSWTETDVMVSSAFDGAEVDTGVHILTLGPNLFFWNDRYRRAAGKTPRPHSAHVHTNNTERELVVTAAPDPYGALVAELVRNLHRNGAPPSTIQTSRQGGTALIETTSGQPVALRLVIPPRPASGAIAASSGTLALLLPDGPHLTAWFRAFLSDIHDCDPDRVPVAPPRLGQPSDWHTPEERDLARQITEAEGELERLRTRREELEVELKAAGQRADDGARRVLWLDGDELVEGAGEILGDFGFTVRDMDATRKENEPRHEDLRLTLAQVPGWEALVEVKGYSSGVRTNDSGQVRKHRERFIKDERRLPDLTLWLTNPHRGTDPSSRPVPDQNVREAAENIGAVHALATDLYKQWVLVTAGELEAEAVIQSLMDAEPGLWTPPDAHSGS